MFIHKLCSSGIQGDCRRPYLRAKEQMQNKGRPLANPNEESVLLEKAVSKYLL
jgi:hypothetical protein